MKFKRYLLNIILATTVASLIFSLAQKGFFRRLELYSLDLSFRLRGPLSFNPQIVLVEITDRDIAKIGRWPWPRSWHASIATALKGLGAKYIYFDIIFSESSAEEDDGLFAEAIKVNQNIYLPFVFQDESFRIENALLPIEKFSTHLKGTGTINIYPDADGTFRRIPLVFPTEKQTYPHAALKLAMDYSGFKIKEIKPHYLILSHAQEEIKVPLIEKNTLLINWLGKWQHTFKHYDFLEVLTGYQDILENKVPKMNSGDFKDSLCLVAVTAIGLYDIRSVPLQPEYPGIGIIATAISNILDQNFLYPPPAGINILLLYTFSLLPAFLIFGEKPLRETIFVFLTAAVYFLAHLLLFQKNIIINFATPISGLLSSYLVVGTYNFVRVSVEKQSFFRMSITDGLTGLFNIRYFRILLETEFYLLKADPNKRFSILMLDIDHFKNFNDTYGHPVGDLVLKEVAGVLKTSVRSSDVVARYGGEEMIILLRGTILKGALGIAEKMRKNIESLVIKDKAHTHKVTVSLGASTFRPGDNADTIIKRADEGLYKAKGAGRNRVETEEGIDEITGLYDVKHFQEILNAECETAVREKDKKLSLVISVIDNFKQLTDTYGDKAGELIIKEIASILQNSVRSSDTVAEYDQDIMVILLRGASLKNSNEIAKKIKKNVEKTTLSDGENTYKITLSMGLARFEPGDTAETLMKKVKQDLYKKD